MDFLKSRGAIPLEATLGLEGDVLRLKFPTIVEVGSTVDLNDIFKQGVRCSFNDLVVSRNS